MDYEGSKSNVAEFHGIPLNFEIVPLIGIRFRWTFMEYSMELLSSQNQISLRSMESHGTRRAQFQMIPGFHGNPWNVPWNFIESLSRKIKCHQVPWNHFNQQQISVDFHGIFRELNGNRESSSQKLPISMEFNRSLWNLGRHIKYHSVSWNSMKFGWRHFKWHSVPWNAMEYNMESHGTISGFFY